MKFKSILQLHKKNDLHKMSLLAGNVIIKNVQTKQQNLKGHKVQTAVQTSTQVSKNSCFKIYMLIFITADGPLQTGERFRFSCLQPDWMDVTKKSCC